MRQKVVKALRKLSVNKAHYKAMKKSYQEMSLTDKIKMKKLGSNLPLKQR